MIIVIILLFFSVFIHDGWYLLDCRIFCCLCWWMVGWRLQGWINLFFL